MLSTTRDRKLQQRIRVLYWLCLQAIGVAAISLGLDYGATALAGGAGVALVCLAVGHTFMYDLGGVPVLVYHSVSPRQAWLPWSEHIAVTPETFDRHIAMLKRRGFTIMRNREFVLKRQAGARMPKRPTVIHLDDGYLDNWVAAAPILRRHGATATVMVSLDFVQPGDAVRPILGQAAADALEWEGYMNWAEIKALDREGVIDVEAHGVDHGRVDTGPEIVDTLSTENWRSLAWRQWREMHGDKSTWHLHASPAFAPIGTPIRVNSPALGARAWRNGALESEAEYEARVRHDLVRVRDVLTAKLGRAPALFCWPENSATPAGRRLALEIGFAATTGGRGENRQGEDPTIVSRVHAGDRALGWPSTWIDDLRLYAACRAFHGVYYWCLILFTIRATRALLDVFRGWRHPRSAT